MAIDIKDLDTRKACDQEVEFELLHPATGKGIGTFIKIVGIESTIMREFERESSSSIADSVGKTPTDVFKDVVDRAIAATTGWRNFVFNDKEMKPSKTNIEKIYRDERFDWIPSQVHKNMSNLKLFMKG